MPIRREPTDEEIAARAHEIYEQHGRTEGRALQDWLQAKAELEAAEVSAETDEVQDNGVQTKSAEKPRRRR